MMSDADSVVVNGRLDEVIPDPARCDSLLYVRARIELGSGVGLLRVKG